jgi:hypothetical protein
LEHAPGKITSGIDDLVGNQAKVEVIAECFPAVKVSIAIGKTAVGTVTVDGLGLVPNRVRRLSCLCALACHPGLPDERYAVTGNMPQAHQR